MIALRSHLRNEIPHHVPVGIYICLEYPVQVIVFEIPYIFIHGHSGIIDKDIAASEFLHCKVKYLIAFFSQRHICLDTIGLSSHFPDLLTYSSNLIFMDVSYDNVSASFSHTQSKASAYTSGCSGDDCFLVNISCDHVNSPFPCKKPQII